MHRGRCATCAADSSAAARNVGVWLVLSLGLFLRLPATAQDSVSIVGAGGSVTLPLFKTWAQDFNKINRSAQMQYQAMGTVEALKLIYGTPNEIGKADFSGGEVILSEKERTEGKLIQLPLVTIAIVPLYNLPNQPQLKFSGDLLAQIYLGHVKNWNAPQIAKLNPGVVLPAIPIKVIHRTPGKGSSFIFTDFLSKVSAEFRNQIGRSPSPNWPVGDSAERSSDMVDKVRDEIGALGYVELQYALTSKLPIGLVQNAAGNFVKASDATINAACKSMEAPQWNDFAMSLTNAPGADSFPIISFSWIYLRSGSPASKRKEVLISVLRFIYTDGQQVVSEQGYAALPPQLLDKIRTKLRTL